MAKKVLILGSTGMLGNAVYAELKDKYSLVITARTKDKIKLVEEAHGGTDKHKIVEFDALKVYGDYSSKKGYPGEYLSNFLNEVGDVDFVINAIGVTIPYVEENPIAAFFINGAMPHILAGIYGERLIHITTDCAYNGKEGFPYNENSPRTPTDVYGLTKILGEPMSCLTIRTSIIGRELEGFSGLLAWFLQQSGKEITGFAEHYWNGVTTKEFSRICDKIISNRTDYPKNGIYHIFSTSVSKYYILQKAKEKFGIDCKIKEDHENKLSRILGTVNDLNKKLEIQSFDKMMEEL